MKPKRKLLKFCSAFIGHYMVFRDWHVIDLQFSRHDAAWIKNGHSQHWDNQPQEKGRVVSTANRPSLVSRYQQVVTLKTVADKGSTARTMLSVGERCPHYKAFGSERRLFKQNKHRMRFGTSPLSKSNGIPGRLRKFRHQRQRGSYFGICLPCLNFRPSIVKRQVDQGGRISQ